MNFKKESYLLTLQSHLNFIDFRKEKLALLKSLLIKIKSTELTEKYFQSTLEEEHYFSIHHLINYLKN